MAIVGFFPFNSFLSRVYCVWTIILLVCLHILVTKNKQGIQGFATITCFCSFCSLHFG
ncbi:hypothetical protein ACSBR2_018210 [Camellia fascicularis]